MDSIFNLVAPSSSQDVLFFLVFVFASLCWKDQRQNNFLGLFWTIWGLKLFFLPVLCINQFGDVSKGGGKEMQPYVIQIMF